MNTVMMYAGYAWSAMAMAMLVWAVVIVRRDVKESRGSTRIWTDSTDPPVFASKHWAGSPMAAYYSRLTAKEQVRRLLGDIEGVTDDKHD